MGSGSSNGNGMSVEDRGDCACSSSDGGSVGGRVGCGCSSRDGDGGSVGGRVGSGSSSADGTELLGSLVINTAGILDNVQTLTHLVPSVEGVGGWVPLEQ